MRGLAPAPPVSLATPRGQGSPLRYDTQPTGWSVGSATRHQGGIRKDRYASLRNLYKASPLTPFRFPERPTVQVSAKAPGELPGENQAVQVSAKAPGELPGENQAAQSLAVVPGELPGENQAAQAEQNKCRLKPSRRPFIIVRTDPYCDREVKSACHAPTGRKPARRRYLPQTAQAERHYPALAHDTG